MWQRDEVEASGGDLEGVAAGSIALLTGGASGHVAMVLEECGLGFEQAHSIESLGEMGGASLVVICLEGTVSAALSSWPEELPEVPILLVCSELRPGETRAALAKGATGIVLEENLASTLESCLAAVRVGQVCVPRRHAPQIEPATLSAREKQILGLVVMGYMNSEIAAQLFVAESTVKSHLSSAFGKLGVRSRNEAVDLIVDPERGLGMGILALGGEPIEVGSAGR
jgi:DNA-binding CsgD family transcriptional regulator